ncbi:hypothetical protein [Clostridium septicum]|uniref:N-acetylmuramoyl-L-alanine amidase n=1 Tax=Clostridium septicum TaxID=1504 RepID=A0A9N7JNF0_CLOSE|nr:hypothetical protein [Clostridium septicum]AYE35374.1 hypothetical protein CP523_13570 [Clostridium septicum]MDU1315236.1 hypothetical protein [Clostridium septicum]QAS60764.1 hypothetical protein EI377_08465 [Clostridium septicum]UEC19971.1 N-acetylmuramoyl-L-alanine amidase [Clostridium septicum]USS01970.1 N-acetylmuramoyl-L-alanine amidase [Clostridium septicum]
MKVGIDINNRKILLTVVEKMKERGHWVVDLSNEERGNKGQIVFRKTLLANVTKVDFYMGIEFVDNISKYELFYDENFLSEVCCNELKKVITRLNKELNCIGGSNLYLVKNTNSPAVYMKIPMEDRDIIEDYCLDEIIEILLKMQ